MATISTEEQIRCLRWLDTIHDFFSVTTTGARGEDIREILEQYYGGDVAVYIKNTLMKDSQRNSVTMNITPSSVEVQTEAFYNKKFNTMMVDNQSSVNVKTIIDKYGVNDATTVLNDLGIFETSIEAKLKLSLTDRAFLKDENKQSATNFLAEVIRRFFFNSTEKPIYFLIDATSGRFDCMFQGINETGTIINALTIGDSAVTSSADKKGKGVSKSCYVNDNINPFKKKKYFEGNNALPYNDPATKRYNITSNEFSKDKFKVWYADAVNVFSRTENASIRLYCQRKTVDPSKVWYTEFSILQSGSPNSGASVGVLKQLIIILDGLTAGNRELIKNNIRDHYKREVITSLNLLPIICGMIDEPDIVKEDIIRFLLDYKRGGDHEQVNSAYYLNQPASGVTGNVVLLTGDRLCALYARLMKQPCVFFHDDNYDMYRYLADLSPAEKKANLIALFTNTHSNIINKLNGYSIDNFYEPTDIQKIDNLIEIIKVYLASINVTDDFFDKLYKISFNCLLIKLERIKVNAGLLKDAAKRLLGTITPKILDTRLVENDNLDEALEYISQQIDDMNSDYNVFLYTYKELLNYLSLKDESLPVEINTKNVSKFKSNAFGYDNKTLNNVRSYFDDFMGAIKAIRDSARDKNVQLAFKKNKIIGWGGGDIYTDLLDDFIKFLITCKDDREISFIFDDIGAMDVDDNLSLDDRVKNLDEIRGIKSATSVILDNPDTPLLIQTAQDYSSIIERIQGYLLDKIPTNYKEFYSVTPEAEPAPLASATLASATLASAPFESAPFESALFESAPFESAPFEPVPFEHVPFEPATLEPATLDPGSYIEVSETPGQTIGMSGGGAELIATLNNVNATIIENQSNMLDDIIRNLRGGGDKVTLLNSKLKKEYELYFNKNSPVDTRNPDLLAYIAKYLKKYIEELIIAHSDTLINACFETIYDKTYTDELVNTYETIYNYIYDLIDARYADAIKYPAKFITKTPIPHSARASASAAEIERARLQQLELEHLISIREAELEHRIQPAAQAFVASLPYHFGSTAAREEEDVVGSLPSFKRQQHPPLRRRQSTAVDDHINELEMRFKKGEITLDYYNTRLKKLNENKKILYSSRVERESAASVAAARKKEESRRAAIRAATRKEQKEEHMFIPDPHNPHLLIFNPNYNREEQQTGREEYATSSTGTLKRKRVGGTRKYIHKKKKKSRKLNKRLKKNITKHNKYKVKKYTRKHYKM
jgi:hypothetical protein